MNVADYYLKRLAAEGIDTAFEVYGGAMSEMMDAFTRQSVMRYVAAQHEQGAVFMAEGYAKAKGVPGLVIVTSGPGGGNIVTGLQNCYYDSTPLIAITGQVSKALMREKGSKLRQRGFQEAPMVEIARPVTKYAVTVEGPMHAAYALETAILEARYCRPGPVVLDVPADLQRAEMPVDGAPVESSKYTKNLYAECDADAEEFMADLAQAERPGILVGGGAYGARDAICAFAEAHSIPVFRTWNALDVVTDDSPVYGGTVGTYGGPGRNFGLQNCDLLLILGSRISGRITGGKPETWARDARRYWVDVDAHLMHEHEVKCDVTVRCDALEFVEALQFQPLQFNDWLAKCRAWVVKYDPCSNIEGWHHYAFMRSLSENAPANAIIVSDTGGNQIMMGHCWKSKRGQRIFSSNGNTPMGFALCGAIGAWFSDPSRPIICIIGDGGMQLNIQELQTIRHYGAVVKVFIINNGVLGNTKAWQRVNSRAEIACGPDGYSAPDFCAIASAYGIPSARVSSTQEAQHIGGVWPLKHSMIVDVVDPDRCNYEPRISRFDLPVEDMYPHLPRDEFRANMLIEPVEGWEKNV